MQRYKSDRIHRICNVIAIIAFVLALLLFLSYRQLIRHISEVCEYKGKEVANDIITEAIDEQLKGSGEQYITIIRDGNKIQSIESNSVEINKTQNDLRKYINNRFDTIKSNKLTLPLGTLTGITFFSGKGPELPLELYQVGSVDTEFKSEFISAGINQTKYKVYLTVKLEVSAILPASSTDIMIDEDYLISETIIVGDMPDIYFGENLLSAS